MWSNISIMWSNNLLNSLFLLGPQLKITDKKKELKTPQVTLVVAIICPSMSVLWHSKCERGGKRGRRVRHTKGVCSATRGGGEGGWRDPVATLLHLAYCTEKWVVKQQPSFLQTSCAFLFSACYKENLAPLAADLWKNQTCLNRIKLVWIGSKVSKLVQTCLHWIKQAVPLPCLL